MADMEQLIHPDSTGSSLLDTILHYALFLGAILQLVCIFAVIFVPPRQDEKVSIFLLVFKVVKHPIVQQSETDSICIACWHVVCSKGIYHTQLPLKTH